MTDWAKQDGTGTVVGASGGFRLPNGALLAPDAAWTVRERLEEWVAQRDALPRSERDAAYPAFCAPTLWLELRSEGDPLAMLQRKMEEYLENGARLGWLIDPINKQVHVYRPGVQVEILDRPGEGFRRPGVAGV